MSGRVLITGASSGLGRQLALDYRHAGWQVWGCGRDAQRLEQLAKAGITPLAFDVRDRAALAQIAAQLPPLDLLILNAGTCEYMTLDDGFDGELFARVIETNLIATGLALEAFLPLLGRGRGWRLSAPPSAGCHCQRPRPMAPPRRPWIIWPPPCDWICSPKGWG